jgi:hypothetical protein
MDEFNGNIEVKRLNSYLQVQCQIGPVPGAQANGTRTGWQQRIKQQCLVKRDDCLLRRKVGDRQNSAYNLLMKANKNPFRGVFILLTIFEGI